MAMPMPILIGTFLHFFQKSSAPSSSRTTEKTAKNFKRPKNREDSSDLDENLTKSIAAMKTIISNFFWGQFSRQNCAKTSRKLRESVVAGVVRSLHENHVKFRFVSDDEKLQFAGSFSENGKIRCVPQHKITKLAARTCQRTLKACGETKVESG